MSHKAANFSLGQVFLRRLGNSILTLLVIAFLTIFGLIMAERGRFGLPAQPLNAAGEALVGTFKHIFDHPTTYIWNHQEIPALKLVWETFTRSAGLLLVSLALAALLGVPLGIAMASRRGLGRTAMVILSILGISTPSFFLAMLLWILNIALFRQLDLKPLPPTGFGWDAHLIMPALVLAMRPLAQIAQVTYVSLSEVMGQDYIRVAQAKGLSWRLVRSRHALRSCLLPIFTTVGASLRFSLSTLPVVEFFFLWPGVGLTLIEAIDAGLTPLITDLILSLGLLFLLVNLFVEFFYPLLDPRVREGAAHQEEEERRSLRERWADFLTALRDLPQQLTSRLKPHARGTLRPLPQRLPLSGAQSEAPQEARASSRKWLVRAVLGNPTLILGTLLVVGLLVLVVYGKNLTSASPYELHGVMMVDGEIGAPPYPPSATFPWGSDHIGRDVQALVLAGARNTLSLAFFGMIARVILGTLLGLLAGWWRNSWFDRLVTGAVGVWAAFPLTLFAMLIIQALGIQQGTWVFVVAICVVGWGEVAQVVRSQAIAIRPLLFIEAANVVGAGTLRVIVRHVLPQLMSSLLVISVLEMGGVLMLLAELGFLNIFLGGGFRIMIGEAARMSAIIASFSDVPEWGAMLSNIRNWWRSYPWMAWYPGVAFFVAIVAFNLWGEGLRRFLDASRLNVARLLNRTFLLAAAAAAVIMVVTLRTTSPLGLYRETAEQFDPLKAMTHISVLTSPELAGRETGTPGADLAAQYIADQMEAIGLMPGGDKGSYFQVQTAARFHLQQVPLLQIVDENRNPIYSYTYGKDFIEWPEWATTAGRVDGVVIGLATGPDPGAENKGQYSLGNYDLLDKIVIVREQDFLRMEIAYTSGVLVISDDPLDVQQRFLYSQSFWELSPPPVMRISRDTADMLLATAGGSLADYEQKAAALGVGEVSMTDPGLRVLMETKPVESFDDYTHVIGYLPGTGSEVRAPGGVNLDHYVIMVGAYYDGLGVAPDGTLYPGANDNASGVATMLEMARVLAETPYQPKRTVIFVAWAGGERREGLSIVNIMSAKVGFSGLAVDAVIELSGVGAGDGETIALGTGSSYRLVQLYDRVAERMGASITTRGRGPHFSMPAPVVFGDRKALSLFVSWDGSDGLAHTPQDTMEIIDPQKLGQVGRTTLLTLMILSREVTGW